MATLKQRLHKRNATGYDTIHLETEASCVFMANGATVESAINSKADSSHNHAASNINSGTLSVARGGTGKGSVTKDSILIGNGTSAMTEMTMDALKNKLGITSASKPSTTPSVGTTLSLADYDWIVVHEDSNYRYLMTSLVIGGIQIGQSYRYTMSQALLICKMFGALIGVNNNPDFGEIEVEGVKGYCHLATYTQANGGFGYFTGNERRLGKDAGGNASNWWLSTQGSGSSVCYVDYNGALSDRGSPSYVYGFRPFIAIRI